MTGYTSNTLYHFVGNDCPDDHEANYAVLSAILELGCVSHSPHGRRSWGTTSIAVRRGLDLVTEELVVPTVTCYCDIPSEHLRLHVGKYGHFGVGLPRRLLVGRGARPVIYVPLSEECGTSPHGAALIRDWQAIFEGYFDFVHGDRNEAGEGRRSYAVKPSSKAEALIAIEKLLLADMFAFVKPFNADLEDDDPDNFYLEREWRMHGNMCFDQADVVEVFVEDSFLERARDDFPQYEDRFRSCRGTRSPRDGRQ